MNKALIPYIKGSTGCWCMIADHAWHWLISHHILSQSEDSSACAIRKKLFLYMDQSERRSLNKEMKQEVSTEKRCTNQDEYIRRCIKTMGGPGRYTEQGWSTATFTIINNFKRILLKTTNSVFQGFWSMYSLLLFELCATNAS